MRKVPFEVVQIDYQWTNEHIKLLTDIRFRLLAIATPLVGVAVTLLSGQAIGTTAAAPAQSGAATILTAAVGLFGFVLTFGVVLYDLRNSQLYNALVHRAKVLEGVLGCVGSGDERMFKPPSATEPLEDVSVASPAPDPHRRLARQGGLHLQRAKRYGELLGVEVGHPKGLGIIYAALLSSWLFPISKAVAVLGANAGRPEFWGKWADRPEIALPTSVFAFVVSVGTFFLLLHLHAQKDPGTLATFLGYRVPVRAPWEQDYDKAVAHYDHPDQKRKRKRETVREHDAPRT